ncbi:hypothetical protein [Enterococcus faecalis]|uniref:hypothetical protein n=1 Tax=Enterococcus faecalis TaxID=1351 RepID=UPI002032D7A6|nr:hypothetical protein [Enterococcus faecalis]
MIDYFEIYKLVLDVVHDERPSDGQEVIKYLSEKNEIQEMRQKFGDKLVLESILEVLDNQIKERMIDGKSIPTKDGIYFLINHLTTNGQLRLQQLHNDASKNEVFEILESEGFPVTPQSISKVLTKLAFKLYKNSTR